MDNGKGRAKNVTINRMNELRVNLKILQQIENTKSVTILRNRIVSRKALHLFTKMGKCGSRRLKSDGRETVAEGGKRLFFKLIRAVVAAALRVELVGVKG
jgi:hypothetical protein